MAVAAESLRSGGGVNNPGDRLHSDPSLTVSPHSPPAACTPAYSPVCDEGGVVGGGRPGEAPLLSRLGDALLIGC